MTGNYVSQQTKAKPNEETERKKEKFRWKNVFMTT